VVTDTLAQRFGASGLDPGWLSKNQLRPEAAFETPIMVGGCAYPCGAVFRYSRDIGYGREGYL